MLKNKYKIWFLRRLRTGVNMLNSLPCKTMVELFRLRCSDGVLLSILDIYPFAEN